MGLLKSIKKFIGKANNIVNDVMRVVDPIGGFLKRETEEKSQAEVNKVLGKLFGPKLTDAEPNSLLGDAGQGRRKAADEGTVKAKQDDKLEEARKNRQGPGAGSTLLVTANDENQMLSRNTLLGL